MLDLAQRMKKYEKISDFRLIQKIPIIIRLDGKGFHKFTKHFEKPFSETLLTLLEHTAINLCKNIQGSKCAYVQSDEISILVYSNNFNWYDNRIQKISSISSAMASSYFTSEYIRKYKEITIPIMFDSRCFNIPENEVVNYFIWRQFDWIRNSLNMLARSIYSHKQCMNKNSIELQNMLNEKNILWSNLHNKWKNGQFIKKVKEIRIDEAGLEYIRNKWRTVDCPVFKDNREEIDIFLKGEII